MKTTRRTFVKQTAAIGVGMSILGSPLAMLASEKRSKIRLGFIGVGLRGQSHMEEALKRKDIEITAICDPDRATSIAAAIPPLEDEALENHRRMLPALPARARASLSIRSPMYAGAAFSRCH